MKDKPKPTRDIRAAIYARVSSEQQTQQSTITSQVEALRERLRADGLKWEEDLCFLDDGYSGSTLVRPGLERLRDVAWAGGFTRLTGAVGFLAMIPNVFAMKRYVERHLETVRQQGGEGLIAACASRKTADKSARTKSWPWCSCCCLPGTRPPRT